MNQDNYRRGLAAMAKGLAAMGALQDQIKQKMESVGLPFREIQVYGSQITVETYGEGTANQWASVINRFATVKRVLKTTDYARGKREINMPQMVEIYRVYATI